MSADLSRLLDGDDAAFVANAYQTMLARAPADEEAAQALARLSQPDTSRLELLARLRYSAEGRAQRVKVRGLLPLYLGERLCKLPVLGYCLRLSAAIWQLPRTLKQLQDLQLATASSHRMLAEQLRRLADELGRQLPKLAGHVVGLPSPEQLAAALEARAEKAQVEQLRQRVESIQQQLGAGEGQQGGPAGELRASSYADQQREAALASIPPAELDLLYAEFEDVFRGSREDIAHRLAVYLPDVERALADGDSGVIDLGCGRGEWLELLKAEKISARGVDANKEMIKRCRQLGLEVTHAEVLEYLRQLPEASVGVITGFHLVEHLSLSCLVALLQQAHRVLRPGGMLILETPNPENLIVGAYSFYTDPSHLRPLVPNALQFLVQQRGFVEVEVRRLHRYSDFYDVRTGDPFVDTWFHGEMDFAVLGVKASDVTS